TELRGRSGTDTILIDTDSTTQTPIRSRFNGLLNIRLGRGIDSLDIVNATVTGTTTLRGRRGSDDVTITGSTMTTLDTRLGRGDDSLSISTTTVSVKTDLNGGSGTNTFTN